MTAVDNNEGRMVLLVDDERTHRLIGRSSLTHAGIVPTGRIIEAASVAGAEQALEQLPQNTEVLVITDLQYPFGRDRLDTDPVGPAASVRAVFKALQARGLRAAPRNVMVTAASGTPEQIGLTNEVVEEIGDIDLIRKPYSLETYTEAVRQALTVPNYNL